jgi:hypothetical protein
VLWSVDDIDNDCSYDYVTLSLDDLLAKISKPWRYLRTDAFDFSRFSFPLLVMYLVGAPIETRERKRFLPRILSEPSVAPVFSHFLNPEMSRCGFEKVVPHQVGTALPARGGSGLERRLAE